MRQSPVVFRICSRKLTLHSFQTYFPHIDNVYSHRSSQRYKRKSFISHYWDCRLKGRPPGTAKSTDPNVKKRKRVARERDLCDVKIKITEYFTGPQALKQGQDNHEENDGSFYADGQGFDTSMGQLHPFGILQPPSEPVPNPPGIEGQKYFTIQRVNGTSTTGKAETVGASHKHTLEESDRVKKNSVVRELAKEEKNKKKLRVSLNWFVWFQFTSML